MGLECYTAPTYGYSGGTTNTSSRGTGVSKNEIKQIFREELERKDKVDALKDKLASGEIDKSTFYQEMKKIDKVPNSYPNSYNKCSSRINYVA